MGLGKSTKNKLDLLDKQLTKFLKNPNRIKSETIDSMINDLNIIISKLSVIHHILLKAHDSDSNNN